MFIRLCAAALIGGALLLACHPAGANSSDSINQSIDRIVAERQVMLASANEAGAILLAQVEANLRSTLAVRSELPPLAAMPESAPSVAALSLALNAPAAPRTGGDDKPPVSKPKTASQHQAQAGDKPSQPSQETARKSTARDKQTKTKQTKDKTTPPKKSAGQPAAAKRTDRRAGESGQPKRDRPAKEQASVSPPSRDRPQSLQPAPAVERRLAEQQRRIEQLEKQVAELRQLVRRSIASPQQPATPRGAPANDRAAEMRRQAIERDVAERRQMSQSLRARLEKMRSESEMHRREIGEMERHVDKLRGEIERRRQALTERNAAIREVEKNLERIEATSPRAGQ
jgi:hypothetical protein